MGLLINPRAGPRTPRGPLAIDWGHPLAKGLVWMMPNTPDYPPWITDLTGGPGLTKYSDWASSTSAEWTPAKEGLFWTSPTGIDGLFTVDAAHPAVVATASNNFTYSVWEEYTGTPTTRLGLMGTSSNTIQTHYSSNFGLLLYQGGYGHTSATVLTANVPEHVVKVFDSSGATNPDKLKAYVNNENISLSYSGTIAAAGSGFNFLNGQYRYVVTGYWRGPAWNARVYNRSLSVDEIAMLYSSEHRWDPVVEVGRTLYFVPAAAPAGGRIMSSLVAGGGLVGSGGIAGERGWLAG